MELDYKLDQNHGTITRAQYHREVGSVACEACGNARAPWTLLPGSSCPSCGDRVDEQG